MIPDDRSLFDDAPCGYLVTDGDGVLLAVNRTFGALTGLDPTALVGRARFVDLLTGGGRIYHETHVVPMLRMHGAVRAVALDLQRADGSRLPVLVNADLATHPTDGTSLTRIVVVDVTERRTYERELLAATRAAEAARAEAVMLAETLQATLIPPVPPRIPGLDLGTVYRPAGTGDEVGGDFYDVFQVTADEWVVVMGDVQGKGARAAVVTSLARHTLRAATVRHTGPAAALEDLNAVLLTQATDRFLTALVLRLRRVGDDWHVVSSAGGHALPILVRRGARPTPYGRAGTLIGVVPAPRLHDDTTVLHPGDRVVLYTDGVTEARRGDEFYGERRLLDAVASMSADAGAASRGLVEGVLDFQGGDAHDDIAVLALVVTGSAAREEERRAGTSVRRPRVPPTA